MSDDKRVEQNDNEDYTNFITDGEEIVDDTENTESVDDNDDKVNTQPDERSEFDGHKNGKRKALVAGVVGVTAAAAITASIWGVSKSGDSPEKALDNYAGMMDSITTGDGDGSDMDDIVRGNLKSYVDAVSSSSEDQEYSSLKYRSPLIDVNDIHVDSEYMAGKQPKYNNDDSNDTISGEDEDARHVDGFRDIEGNKSVVALRGDGTFIGSKNGETAEQPFVAMVSKIDGDGGWKVESIFPYSQIDGE